MNSEMNFISYCPACGDKVQKAKANDFMKDGRFVCLQCQKEFRITIDKVKLMSNDDFVHYTPNLKDEDK